MIRQNILNYDFPNIDIRLSDSFVDLTLCNENFKTNDELNSENPIDYTSNKLFLDLTNSLTNITTISLTDGTIILSLPYSDFINHFGVLYSETFLPTDSYILIVNSVNKIMTIENYNQTLSKGIFPDLTYDEIIGMFDISVQISGDLDESREPKFKPYPYKTKIGEETLFNIRENVGWTMEFYMNNNVTDWTTENTFFYLGTRGTNVEKDYVNNSMSFSFNNEKKLSVKYTTLNKICGTEMFFENITQESKILPKIDGLVLVTLVFVRDFQLYDCDLLNKGGVNDLISNNDPEKIHQITKKWLNGKKYRMGKLKIYINGKFVQTLYDIEETILSERGIQPYIMKIGGGVKYINNFHNTPETLNVLKYRYYDEPLSPLFIRHNFKFKY